MQEKMLTNSNIKIKLFSFKLIDNGEYVVNLVHKTWIKCLRGKK